jgi:uncharacterized membrane protein YqiK
MKTFLLFFSMNLILLSESLLFITLPKSPTPIRSIASKLFVASFDHYVEEVKSVMSIDSFDMPVAKMAAALLRSELKAESQLKETELKAQLKETELKAEAQLKETELKAELKETELKAEAQLKETELKAEAQLKETELKAELKAEKRVKEMELEAALKLKEKAHELECFSAKSQRDISWVSQR